MTQYNGDQSPNCVLQLLQQIVCDGGLYFDAGKQGVERRRHHFAGPERGRAHKHELVAERIGGHVPGENIGRRHVRERFLLSSIPKQQITLPVEWYGPVVENQRRGIHV